MKKKFMSTIIAPVVLVSVTILGVAGVNLLGNKSINSDVQEMSSVSIESSEDTDEEGKEVIKEEKVVTKPRKSVPKAILVADIEFKLPSNSEYNYNSPSQPNLKTSMEDTLNSNIQDLIYHIIDTENGYNIKVKNSSSELLLMNEDEFGADYKFTCSITDVKEHRFEINTMIYVYENNSNMLEADFDIFEGKYTTMDGYCAYYDKKQDQATEFVSSVVGIEDPDESLAYNDNLIDDMPEADPIESQPYGDYDYNNDTSNPSEPEGTALLRALGYNPYCSTDGWRCSLGDYGQLKYTMHSNIYSGKMRWVAYYAKANTTFVSGGVTFSQLKSVGNTILYTDDIINWYSNDGKIHFILTENGFCDE